MGIDRIGRGAVPGSTSDVGMPAKATAATSAFHVSKAAAPPAIAAAGIEPSTALERLRSGQIDLGGYVDLKVNEATAHLSSLPPLQLQSIKDALRERLADDASLRDLLRAATGETLPTTDD